MTASPRQIALVASETLTTAKGQKFTAYQGDDSDLNFTMSPAVDVSGWTFLYVQRGYTTAADLGTEFTRAGILVSGPGGTFTVAVAKADTDDLYAYDGHEWELRRTVFGAEDVIASGTCNLLAASPTAGTAAPVFTSAATISFTPGTAASFSVVTTGSPSPVLTCDGILPDGVTFTDNGNGTATLAGVPTGGTDLASPYVLTYTATNGVGVPVLQTFTLIVNPFALGGALFNGTSNFLSRANPPLLSPGATPFSVGCWVQHNTIGALGQGMIQKYDGTGNQKEYGLQIVAAQFGGGWKWSLSNDGLNNDGPTVIPVGGVLPLTWYFVVATFAPNDARVSFNAGTQVVYTAFASLFQGSADFTLGKLHGTASTIWMDGTIARAFYYARALTPLEITTLYNGGHSLRYAQLSVGQKIGLTAWWDCTEAAGTTRLDSTANALNLSDNNNVGLDPIGPPVGAPGVAAQLGFGVEPSAVALGAVISPSVTVLVQDGSGATVTTSTASVTIALTSGSGLTGTLTRAAVAGVATFNDLEESVAGTYTLTATSSGLTAATSASFQANVGAAAFTAASSMYLSRANPATLSPGASNFSVACWVKMTSKPAAASVIAGKSLGTGNQREWFLAYSGSGTGDVFQLRLCVDGITFSTINADLFGSPSAGVWYLLTGTWDGTTAKIFVNTTINSAFSYAGPVFAGTADFNVGATNTGTASFWNGDVARLGVWVGRALSGADITTLYNGGVSFQFSTLPAGLGTSLSSWWDLGEASGATRADSVGGLNLTDHATVARTTGPP